MNDKLDSDEFKDGWVRLSAYERLSAENAALRGLLEQDQQRWDDIRVQNDKLREMIQGSNDHADRLIEQNCRFRGALQMIACYDQGRRVTSTFDEPGSAQMARDALEGK